MFISALKNKIYRSYVEFHPDVRSHYEGYKDCNLAYHKKHRLQSLKFLHQLRKYYKNGQQGDFPVAPRKYVPKACIVNAKVAVQSPKPQNAQKVTKTASISVNAPKKSTAATNVPQVSAFVAKADTNELVLPENSYKKMSVDEWVAKLEKEDVVSFDVFDTLIFRCFDNPKEIFWLIGNDLFIPNFYNIRVKVEKELRENSPTNEVTLDDIYSKIAQDFGIDKEKGIEIELTYESKVCYANPFMFEVYKKLLERNKKIIATSNMYLNKEQIRNLLYHCGYTYFDEIFVSCKVGLNKRLGKLQSYIQNYWNKDKLSIIHVGDNYPLDVEGSRIAGWKACYYENINSKGNPYRSKDMSVIAGSLYKGLVNAKLHSGFSVNRYYEYGYANIGYLTYGFCQWLNQLAVEKHIDKFLFVARDMNVVYHAYQKYFHDVDSAYIKASRTSTIHLSFDRHIEHFITWHIQRRISSKMRIREVLEELEYSFLECYLPEFDLDPDEILTVDNLLKVKALIFSKKSMLLPLYEEERQAAKKYYKEVIGDAKNICIVDLGWKGSTANSLDYFLNVECNMNVNLTCALIASEGQKYVEDMIVTGKLYSYLFSSQHNTDLMLEHNKNGNIWRRMYEMLFTSTEDSLLKFALDSEQNVAFEYLRKEIRDNSIIEEMHQGILGFVHDFTMASENLGVSLTLYPRDTYKPLYYALKNTTYNLELFQDFEVCFLAGNVKKEEAELFKDVVNKERA